MIENTVVPIANGGTGESTLAGAKQALGIQDLAEQIGTLNSNLTIVQTWNETDYYAVLIRMNKIMHLHYVRKTECSDGAQIFTVPSGYRPSSAVTGFFIAHHSDGNNYSRASQDGFTIGTNGKISVIYAIIATGAKFALDAYWSIS
jgi:hypothetical protein